MLPYESDSTSITPLIVVSKSEADTTSLFLDNSKRKLSKIGIVLLELITPPMVWSFLNKYELDTINLITL